MKVERLYFYYKNVTFWIQIELQREQWTILSVCNLWKCCNFVKKLSTMGNKFDEHDFLNISEPVTDDLLTELDT